MGIKTKNVGYNSVRFESKSNGINFIIPNNRDLTTLYPAIADSGSSGISKFSFNMGQNPFVGDSKGYAPFHVDYNPANLTGNFSTEGVENTIVVPNNLSTVVYNLKYTSGKYYFEITIEDSGWYGAIGVSPSDGNHFTLLESGVGVSGIGDARSVLNYFSDIRISEKGSYNSSDDSEYPYSQYNMYSGDVLQVFIDYDNNNITIKKVGTAIEDHINYEII